MRLVHGMLATVLILGFNGSFAETNANASADANFKSLSAQIQALDKNSKGALDTLKQNMQSNLETIQKNMTEYQDSTNKTIEGMQKSIQDLQGIVKNQKQLIMQLKNQLNELGKSTAKSQ